MKRKRNIKAVFCGILVVIAFCCTLKHSCEGLNIREHGKIVNTTISSKYSRNFMSWVQVKIDGKDLGAGPVQYENGPKVGDSIEVCYIPEENRVVQTRMNTTRYYLFFAVEFFILLVGLYLIIGGIIGEKVSDKKPYVKTSKRERRKML